MHRVTIGGVLLSLLAGCTCGPSGEECTMLAEGARTFTTAATAQHTGGCSTDGDCVLYRPMLSCYTACPRAIAASRRSNAETDVAGLDENVCMGSACSVTEGCEVVHARCSGGVCRTLSGAGDGGTRDGG